MNRWWIEHWRDRDALRNGTMEALTLHYCASDPTLIVLYSLSTKVDAQAIASCCLRMHSRLCSIHRYCSKSFCHLALCRQEKSFFTNGIVLQWAY